MKKLIILSLAGCLSLTAAANTPVNDDEKGFVMNEQDLQPLTPTYLDNVYGSSAWGSNWFLSVKGGMSAFIGKPVGHGDFFDRTEPMLNASLGKFFSPYFGARLAYQGLKLKDSNIESRSYQNLHVDLLYNVSSHFRSDYEALPRWDFILYAGTGIIRNSYTHQKPFAMSYGFIGRYRIGGRLHVAAEIGGTTTWRNFDGIGEPNKLGDNLLQASLGLTVDIGKVGFQRVIDPKPYIFQNDILMDYMDKMKEENNKLAQQQKKDAMALSEMRKILEIEGLLEKYNLQVPEDEQLKAHPKNNYSGLNSLRARLRNRNTAAVEEDQFGELETEFGDISNDSVMSPEEYFKVMKDGKIYVGAPVFFFFKLAKDELTEKAQLINLKEVASTIKRFGLHARIVGAADSQTGTAYLNERLSAKRADYIAKLLREQGVPQERITVQYQGGISSYEPTEGNRNTSVMLFFQ